ncbi:DUF1501 domain-containing protein [Rhodopirellula europaea]|uniref:DUF1501 domain-containing protein n=1 Tax=Rhodopirellula europaea TaxID=1263866 RepID=UPI003D2D54D2|tara:strand:+ start:25721 stop:27211 length:1491 start_codon:yes stop_codon:yes gene_type:complete
MNQSLIHELGLRQSQMMTRRSLFGSSAAGLGAMALGKLLAAEANPNATASADQSPSSLASGLPHFAPKAKRVIYLFQSGGPSHIDLFDHKDELEQLHGTDLPDSVRGGQRLTGMTSRQSQFPVVKPLWGGKRCGQHGTWVGNLLPHLQEITDDISIVRSMWTEAINHDPAVTYINTGSQQMGHASMGAWLSYGLGSENEDFPAYMVLLSQGSGKNPGQPLFSRLWGSGYLPSSHQGVMLRPGANPVLYLKNPNGVSRDSRRQLLDTLGRMNQMHSEATGDPETLARIEAYEMAYRMQTSVPELTDVSDEPESTFELYGEDARRPGSYAANCLLARRMAERGVRFIQLFHRGWDQHISIRNQLPHQCKDVDQASAALVQDLKRLGMLDDTLVIWGGEFGRTVYSQGQLENPSSGRDHHGRCFTTWMAGGGVKSGFDYGTTDEFSYNIVENPVHIRDLNATVLNLLGIDHERFTFKFRGLSQRLTGVEEAHVIRDLIA